MDRPSAQPQVKLSWFAQSLFKKIYAKGQLILCLAHWIRPGKNHSKSSPNNNVYTTYLSTPLRSRSQQLPGSSGSVSRLPAFTSRLSFTFARKKEWLIDYFLAHFLFVLTTAIQIVAWVRVKLRVSRQKQKEVVNVLSFKGLCHEMNNFF
jgi:hypothetical protein